LAYILQRESLPEGWCGSDAMRVNDSHRLTAAGGATSTSLPVLVRIGGIAFRTLFILILAVLTVRVASPQNESVWSSYETPGDLIRIVLGFAVCVWLVTQIFRLPKDSDGYWTWIYLSPLIPLSLLCTIEIW
jgi:hypothetical protein